MLLALVFGALFLTVFSGLSGYVLSENNFEVAKRAQSEATAIAEAGLEYYRWHLAHFPNDLQNGTGHAGPYVMTYADPEGSTVGTYSLDILGNQSCGQTTSVDIRSTGAPADVANVSKTLIARYAQPTVAQYAYIVNDSVWAGPDRVIKGPYHSNGGVRMDGAANALVTSSLSSWTCTSDFGCSPNQTKPGVFGSGSDQELWNYPTPQVDFDAIAANFTTLRSIAQSNGVYLPRYSSGNANSAAYHKGYHLIFNANGTVTVERVTSTSKLTATPLNSADSSADYSLIQNETMYNTYTIPSSCGLIFVEDNAWIEGVVPSKATVVVANVSDQGVTSEAYLHGNLSYSSTAAGLTLISQNDILITPDSPQDMTLEGIFVAQGGAFGRNYYSCATYPSYSQKGTLTMLGTTVSNKRTGTQWSGSACGKSYSSGYATRVDSFDRAQFAEPPPFTPILSTDYQFIDWRQE